MNFKKVILSLVVVPCLMAILSFNSNAAIKVQLDESFYYLYTGQTVLQILDRWNQETDTKIFEIVVTPAKNDKGKLDNTTVIYWKNFKTDKSLPKEVLNHPNALGYCLNGDIYINKAIDFTHDWPENASKNVKAKKYSITGLISHELGHVIGMEHSKNIDDTMCDNLEFAWKSMTLTKADKEVRNQLVKEYKKTGKAMYLKAKNGPGRTAWK